MRLPFLDHDPLRREFRSRGPWVTRFRIGDRTYGGKVDLVEDARIERFAAAFPDARSVLELGSLEGAHSISLARRVEHVVAVEGRHESIARARFVQELLGVANVTFVEADLETTPLEQFGRFDAVFCVGLLYHLPQPWLLLDQLAAVAPRVLLQTHYAASAEATVDGLPGRRYREHGRRDPLSGLSPSSFWLTLPALTGRLEQGGYAVELLEDDPSHRHGPIVTVAARKAEAGVPGRGIEAELSGG
jgi:SAM-dependent methyltransferase